MKFIIALAIALTTLVVNAQISPVSVAITVGQWVYKNTNRVYHVRVEGRGANAEAARAAGFRKAIELAVGTVVLGESVAKDNVLIRNDIITYSSGYVDDFVIISQTETSVVMDVWVSDSKIANRLEAMGVSTTSTVNGSAMRRDWDRRQAQEDTDARRQADAAALITAVLADYPKMAYTVAVSRSHLAKNFGRPEFMMQVKVDFSEKYADSLNEVLERTRHGKKSMRPNTDFQIERGWANFTFGFWNDGTRSRWISTFNQPVDIEIDFGDRKMCWPVFKEFDGAFFGYIQGSNTYVLNARKTVRLNIKVQNLASYEMSDSNFVDWAGTINKLEARVVDSRLCGK